MKGHSPGDWRGGLARGTDHRDPSMKVTRSVKEQARKKKIFFPVSPGSKKNLVCLTRRPRGSGKSRLRVYN